MADHVIKTLGSCNEKEIGLIDEFVIDIKSNGEFINSVKFLRYHPEGRFEDDSVAVFDKGSGTVRGFMAAACQPDDKRTIISHPGTTFAGPIVNRKMSIAEIGEVLNLMLDYYEEKYESVVIKTLPQIYGGQYFGSVDYCLLRRGYIYGMTALANVINIAQMEKEDDLLCLYDSAKRNHTKKVLKSGLFSFDVKDNKIHPEVWQAMNSNLNQKFASHTTHTYEEILELQGKFPEQIVPYYVNTHDGEYGAFALVFKFKNVFHTQYLDTNYKYTGQYPNLLLIYELIKTAKSEGCHIFSFGASTENGGDFLNTGLYNYKAGYGGGDIILPKFVKG